MELSAVQPPPDPKGAAQQICPPTVPLKTASPSSYQIPHCYVGGHATRQRGQARRGKAKKSLRKRPLQWTWPLAGTTSLAEAGTEYPEVSLFAKAVTGPLNFPASPHKPRDLRGQIPTTLSVVCSIFAA